jgi:hypothetical protein
MERDTGRRFSVLDVDRFCDARVQHDAVGATWIKCGDVCRDENDDIAVMGWIHRLVERRNFCKANRN